VSNTITSVREQLAEKIHASAKDLKPAILAARAEGSDDVAVELTRKHTEYSRLACKILNEKWPGE
jgi:hypothetical protein